MSQKMELAELAQKFRNNASAVLSGDQVADEILNWAADFTIVRASSPAQEPVTTEPVAWRYRSKKWSALLWRYQTEALVNDDFETLGDWLIEPLYAIPTPPQPGRDANDKHYLAAIRHHLKRLYSIYPNNAQLREQISDEIDWIDATLTGESK